MGDEESRGAAGTQPASMRQSMSKDLPRLPETVYPIHSMDTEEHPYIEQEETQTQPNYNDKTASHIQSTSTASSKPKSHGHHHLSHDFLSHHLHHFHHHSHVKHAPTDTRAIARKYVIRRPRALQFKYKGRIVKIGDSGIIEPVHLKEDGEEDEAPGEPIEMSESNSSEDSAKDEQRRSTDRIEKQRGRLDLFIDLLWVGIISNVSEHFYTQCFRVDGSDGRATLEFILLFLPAYRIWMHLQYFLSSYFMDDMVQRLMIVWVLILGLIYGNNAPFVLNPSSDNLDTSADANYTIVTYLIAVMTIVFIEMLYSIWIPWLRRGAVIGSVLALPSVGLWVATTLSKRWQQIYIMIAAIAYDYGRFLFMQSSFAHRLMGEPHFRKHHNVEYSTERMETFFIICLGEGVFLLVRGSPLGSYLNPMLWRGVLAFLIYYALHWLYFYGDQSKYFIHAQYRSTAIAALWQFLHVNLYACLVLLSSGVLYLIQYDPTKEGEKEKRSMFLMKRAEETVEISMSHDTLVTASATVGVCIGLILFTQGIIALLNRSRDAPGTLMVDSRWIRVAPRFAASIVCVTVWLAKLSDPTTILGIFVAILWSVFYWEWYCGMEKGGGFLEPKVE